MTLNRNAKKTSLQKARYNSREKKCIVTSPKYLQDSVNDENLYEEQCRNNYKYETNIRCQQVGPYGPRPWWKKKYIDAWWYERYYNKNAYLRDYLIDLLKTHVCEDLALLITKYCKDELFWNEDELFHRGVVPIWFQS